MPGRNNKRNSSAQSVRTPEITESNNNIQKLIFEFLAPLQDEIVTLKAEMLEVKKSQEFICNKYESLKSDYERLSAVNKKQEDEIIRLTKRGEDLLEVASKEAEKVHALEQYGCRQNLEIIGVSETEKEDTAEIVMEVAKALNVPISRSDISIAHRLPTKPSRNENQLPQPPAIIARFVKSGRPGRTLLFSCCSSPWPRTEFDWNGDVATRVDCVPQRLNSLRNIYPKG